MLIAFRRGLEKLLHQLSLDQKSVIAYGVLTLAYWSEDKSNDFVKLAHSTGENGTIAVNLKNLLLAHFYEKICKKSGFLSPNLVDVDYTLTEFNAEPSLWEALPEQDFTFDDYVLVDTDIAVRGALSDAEIGPLDHNNTESDEDESEELTPVTLS
ncbi:hypothetical protein TNCV_2246671 [Trichonephila clavipes]|nr:hypothetical protein TNCV_2246671 [Trichonephila clavipes]